MTSYQATLTKYWTAVGRGRHYNNSETTDSNNNNGTTNKTNNNVTSSPQIHNTQIMQQSINRGLIESSNDQYWGDTLNKKPENSFRIAFRNIKSLPTSANNNRNEKLVEDINKGEFDIFGAAEVNICWKNMHDKDRLRERFRGCFEAAHYIASYNQDKNCHEKRQFGGTTIISTNKACHRIISSGVDPTKMGR
jgi:hypothetical protein